jgi:histidinol-phosphatase (PHP family)
VEDYCQAAFEKGFDGIGFSAHAPVDGLEAREKWLITKEKLPYYIKAVENAKTKWAGKLNVFLGLEVDYIKDVCGPSEWSLRRTELGLDFIIGAVHFVPLPRSAMSKPKNLEECYKHMDGSPESFEKLLNDDFRGNVRELVRVYWRCVKDMVAAGGYDIAAHLDMIKKNNPHDKYFRASLDDNAYREGFEAVLETIAVRCQSQWAATGKIPFVVEVNTGGLSRGKTSDTYPSAEMILELGRSKIPLTLSGDDHNPKTLGMFYDAAFQNLRNAGYNELYHLDKNKGWVGELIG